MPYWFDGNNLIGQSAERSRADRETRRHFLALLSSYSTVRRERYLVFFDGDDPDRSSPPRGIQLRYSSPQSSDNAILERICGTQNPQEVIVVTNDRGLGHRCRDAGARTMDWAQFIGKMKAGEDRPRQRSKQEEAVKIEEWIQYFGLDKKSLE